MPQAKSTNNFGQAIVYTQDVCLQHRNIASGGAKSSLERPERLHAVNISLAAIYSRIEEIISADPSRHTTTSKSKGRKAPRLRAEAAPAAPFTILRSTALLDEIPLHPAARDVLYIKNEPGDDGERRLTYAETLELWCKESRQKIVQRQREIPEGLEQDLYCEPSLVI